MGKSATGRDPCVEVRQEAEDALRRLPAGPDAAVPEEAQRLFHELQVHQIELETQNEELRRAQLEIDASRARYFDLYNLAPVGYFTLNEQGLILEANLIPICSPSELMIQYGHGGNKPWPNQRN